MLGVSLASGWKAPDLAARLLAEGLVVNPIGADTIRLLPPLVIGEAEVDDALEIVRRVLD
jgi:acetylornithine/succinyldiaminopimelate/putrescine aminotransferase